MFRKVMKLKIVRYDTGQITSVYHCLSHVFAFKHSRTIGLTLIKIVNYHPSFVNDKSDVFRFMSFVRMGVEQFLGLISFK